MTEELNNSKKSSAVERRKGADKKLVLEQLRQVPIVQIACQKTGISRATFYRWKNESEIFIKEVDEALAEGIKFINDLSESQLINLIKNQQMPAIAFWLRHHHDKYKNQIEIDAHVNQLVDELSPEQNQLIEKALKLASLLTIKLQKDESENNIQLLNNGANRPDKK